MTLMALSNEHGHLVLATGNKSELAVGYSTIYGDAVGGFAPIKDVPKTWVWRLARWRNADAEARGEKPPIPEASISKPPSAELRPGQLDTDSLPPYDVLDDILDDYVEQDRGSGELLAAGFDQDAGREGAAPGRPGGVQAPPVPTGPEDLVQGVRPRPPAAHHQPLAGARAAPLTAAWHDGPCPGTPLEEPRGTPSGGSDDRGPVRPLAETPAPTAPDPRPRRRRPSGSACTTCGR